VSHSSHAVPSAYLPWLQLVTHAPLSNSGVPLAGHAVQPVEPALSHSSQLEWQSVHTAASPDLSAYV
jgi:hypothetical protein